MKFNLTAIIALLFAGGLPAVADADPAYVSESPLPEGWPEPGPYNQVVEKPYPAYRAAFTVGRGEGSQFWTLFAHIRRNGIPMTAPVEMAVEPGERGGMRRNSMAFLYQNQEVGATGEDGERVEIRDVPAARTLSYAWQGADSKENMDIAKTALEAALAERKLEAKGFRLLGYNGPGTPRAKKTWELQAMLE